MKNFTLKITAYAAALILIASCSSDAVGDDIESSLALDKTLIFTTSNTSGLSEIISVSDGTLSLERSLNGSGMDNAGVFYDGIEDCLIQASRSEREVRLYDNIKTTRNGATISPTSVSADGFLNARDIANNGNGQIIVSSDAAQPGEANKFFIYDVTPAGLVFNKQFVTNNQNWGIDLNGADMYAVSNNTNRVAIFNNVFAQNGQILNADNQVIIEGATNLKGLTYDRENDILILTDVRNQFNDSDGAIIIVDGFSAKLATVGSFGTITQNMYRKIEGANTTLGTPLDVQYNPQNRMIYVADRSTNAGSVLAFDIRNNTAAAAPVSARLVQGVSSIYLKR